MRRFFIFLLTFPPTYYRLSTMKTINTIQRLRNALKDCDCHIYRRTAHDDLMGSRPQVVIVLHNNSTDGVHAISTTLESSDDYAYAYNQVVAYISANKN